MNNKTWLISGTVALLAGIFAAYETTATNYVTGFELPGFGYGAIAASLYLLLALAISRWGKWGWLVVGLAAAGFFPLLADLMFPHATSYKAVLPFAVLFVLPPLPALIIAVHGYLTRHEDKYDDLPTGKRKHTLTVLDF